MKKILTITTISLLAFTGYIKNPDQDINKDIDHFEDVIDACLYEIELKNISDSLSIEVKNSSNIVKERIKNIRNDSVKKVKKIKVQSKKITSLKTQNRTLKNENIKLNKEIEKLVKVDKIEDVKAEQKDINTTKKGFIKKIFTKKDKK